METYGQAVERMLGRPVRVSRIAASSVPDAERAVAADDPSRALLGQADVIIVQVGYNNALPDPETGIGCGGSLSAGIPAWISSTRPDCLAAGVSTYGEIYAAILAELKRLREGEPTVFVVTDTINGNLDPADPEGLLGVVAPEERDAVREWAVAAYERWNAMLAEQADIAGFVLVDLYHAFNGVDGTRPSGALSVDGAHPSQAGNDLIADLLAEVDLSALAG